MSSRVVSFTGLTTAGAIINSAFRAGDKITFMRNDGAPLGNAFASFIAVDGELLQYQIGDLSSLTCFGLLE